MAGRAKEFDRRTVLRNGRDMALGALASRIAVPGLVLTASLLEACRCCTWLLFYKIWSVNFSSFSRRCVRNESRR